jgi:two-component system chemotaxis response regulator CheB
LLVEKDNLALSTEARVHWARPSIDVLFESAADIWAEQTIGVILTGANADGAQGLARIKKSGGLAVVQDPAEALYRAMPDAAIAACRVDRTLPLAEIAPLLAGLCRGPMG